jgi:putative transposase
MKRAGGGDMSTELTDFLNETNDIREYKRAMAVHMVNQGSASTTIGQVLQVSPSCISKWKRIFTEAGADALKRRYRGSSGYLMDEQRVQTLQWIRDQQTWSVPALQAYRKDTFGVEYQSMQRYYALFHDAGLSWKKAQPTNKKKTRRSLLAESLN